ncbi:hypothetical protein C8F01DRAFT_1101126, partial [Mycena amicta]
DTNLLFASRTFASARLAIIHHFHVSTRCIALPLRCGRRSSCIRTAWWRVPFSRSSGFANPTPFFLLRHRDGLGFPLPITGTLCLLLPPAVFLCWRLRLRFRFILISQPVPRFLLFVGNKLHDVFDLFGRGDGVVRENEGCFADIVVSLDDCLDRNLDGLCLGDADTVLVCACGFDRA